MRTDPFLWLAFGTAGLAALGLVWFLVRRPKVTREVKIVLLFAIGVLPIATAANGNIADYHAMKTRQFCGSCHVMTPYAEDSGNPLSMGLAARHGRNEAFGAENCYTCHSDYGMFGTITTKLGGLRHVYEYALNYHQLTLAEALPKIHIRQPFPNSTCIRCHSTTAQLWLKVGDHASALDDVRAGRVSCASAGCHGPAHPFSYAIHERDKAEASAKAKAGAP